MEATPKRRAVSKDERARYRARLPNDAEWGRPTEATARKICSLLDVDPKSLRAPRDDADHVAAQAFTLAIDWVIRLGDRGEYNPDTGELQSGARMTFNGLFDTLAPFWSMKYRAAQSRGATVSYDMTEAALTGEDGGAWRELLAAGVNVETIWDLLIRQTVPPKKTPRKPPPPPHPGLARIYILRRASGRRHSEGRKVQLYDGQLLDDVRWAILTDPQYERPIRMRLLRADATAPELPTRQEICEERPYDAVPYGQRSRDVIAILERARLRFYVEQFREDFEALDGFRRHQPRPHRVMRAHRRGWERVEQTVRALRPIYEQTAGLTDLKRDVGGRAYVMIRSRFFRAINRRFNAADFWPEHVPGDLRERWFGADDASEHFLVDAAEYGLGHIDDFVEVGDAWTQQFAERDMSSSQTQIQAVFLGEPELEALATDPNKKFKVWLAEQLFALHEQTPGGLLADGYTGPDDPRMVAFVKELWMRRNYGGKFGQTMRALARDPVTFGPGWNCKRSVFEIGGVKEAESFWLQFLGTLPAWSKSIDTFLAAGQYIGKHADTVRGLVPPDPLDGAEQPWNPVRRATKKLPAGKHYIEVRLPGELREGTRFIPRPWRVDTTELEKRVAPCLVHMMDAYVNALVLGYLDAIKIAQKFAVHDGWFIPESVETDLRTDEGRPLDGAEILDIAIEHVGAEWLSGTGRVPDPDKPLDYYTEVPPDPTRPGLRVVYDWFVNSLKGSPYEAFAIEIRDRWRKRVAEKRWPRFTAS